MFMSYYQMVTESISAKNMKISSSGSGCYKPLQFLFSVHSFSLLTTRLVLTGWICLAWWLLLIHIKLLLPYKMILSENLLLEHTPTSNEISCVKESHRGLWADSPGKSICKQAWQHESNPWDPHSWMKKLHPASCPVIFTQALWHACLH